MYREQPWQLLSGTCIIDLSPQHVANTHHLQRSYLPLNGHHPLLTVTYCQGGELVRFFVCLFLWQIPEKNHLKRERTDLISMSEFLSTLGWPHCFLPYFSGKLCKQVCSPRDCQEAKRQEGAGARCFFLGHTPGDLLPPKKCHRYKSTPCMVNPLLSSVPSWSNHFQQWQHMTPLQGWGGHLKSNPRGHGLVFNE